MVVFVFLYGFDDEQGVFVGIEPEDGPLCEEWVLHEQDDVVDEQVGCIL